MSIVSLAFEDLDSGWTLEETRFGPLNLLVGPSGAGKTRILDALLTLRALGQSASGSGSSSKWRLVLESRASNYEWKGEIENLSRHKRAQARGLNGEESGGNGKDSHWSHRFVSEQIVKDGEIIVRRNLREFIYDKNRLPLLNPLESAVSLLRGEDRIQPLQDALSRIRIAEDPNLPPQNWIGKADAEGYREGLKTDLANLATQFPLLLVVKLYVLERHYQDVFKRIVEEFRNAFPTVTDLRVDTVVELQIPGNWEYQSDTVVFAIKEDGVSGWIPAYLLSAGMLKTLNLLTEVQLAPKDTVFLIDELENSLGVNCLPEVASLMLRGLDTRQFIVTSHHPRVINEIPFERWKLVTRQGSKVRVLDASAIPALQTAASLERFTQLLNLPEYEEGIS